MIMISDILEYSTRRGALLFAMQKSINREKLEISNNFILIIDNS